VALKYAGLTIPAAASINAAASPRALQLAGARDLVPLTYGEDRVQGRVLNALVHATDPTLLLVQVLWGHACNQVDTFRWNDQTLPGTASTTTYTGSQVTADSTLVAAFSAQSITYTDALTGFAYTVFAVKIRDFDGQLNFSARVQGRKLYDPRLDSTNGGSGSHRLATPSTWAYSTNPSLALADWLYSSTYGCGLTVLWSSVITAANANDASIGSPSETHRKIGATFLQAVAAPDMAEALRAYAGVWLVPTSGGVKLLPDATASSVATYAHASGQIAAIDALQLRDLGNSPTAVEVVYTDTTGIPWRDGSAIAERSGAGTTLPWRQSTVRLPGIQRYSQALREATERLNKLYLSDLQTTIEVFDIGIQHEIGDVVTVSHPVGLVSKLFRIADAPVQVSPGRWRLGLAEYDPAVYSTSVATGPTYSNSGAVIGPDELDAGGNLLRNSSFEADIDADGLADNWTAYSAGTTGTVTYSQISGGAIHGTYRQRFSGSGLGTGTGDRIGVYQAAVVSGGQPYILSVWCAISAGTPKLRLYIDWYDASVSFISGTSAVFTPGATLTRVSLSADAPATAAYARAYFWMADNGSVTTATMDIDAAQFQPGTVLTGHAPREDDILSRSVDTPQLAIDAASAKARTDYTSSILYSGAATLSVGPYNIDGPTLSTTANGRVQGCVTGKCVVGTNTTAARWHAIVYTLQLVRTSDGVVVDESGQAAADIYAHPYTPLGNSTTQIALNVSLVFDAVAATSYKVRLRILSVGCEDATGYASNITALAFSGEVTAIELKA
jgi:hypothetical protein